MAKITYLIGAGASADSLPMVGNFAEELEGIIYQLTRYLSRTSSEREAVIDSDKTVINEAIEDLNLLLHGCYKHRSVDTFAKMLFLTQKDSGRAVTYRKVKCAIILFFEMYRFFNNRTDKRYDAFLATLMNHEGPKFPANVNIISWNYDYEFERAYMNYLPDDTDIHEVYKDLNIIHKNHKDSKSIGNNFGILKINGTAGFFSNDNKIILGLNNPTEFALGEVGSNRTGLIKLLQSYHEYSYNGEYEPAISFSWEGDNGHVSVMEEIENAVRNTHLLIVVGYSFPYFNRLTDKKIFSSMKLPTARVIVQNKLAEEFVETLQDIKLFSRGDIKTITNSDQFYMNI